jgi:hypothetical protein
MYRLSQQHIYMVVWYSVLHVSAFWPWSSISNHEKNGKLQDKLQWWNKMVFIVEVGFMNTKVYISVNVNVIIML